MSESPKKLGRPSNADIGIKKGRSSWAPASLNEFSGKEDGYRYRMSHKEANNLAKKEREGWETVTGGKIKHEDAGRIDDGAKLTSVFEGHDWVLQRIPEELALERDAYYNNETSRRVQGLTAHIKKDLGKESAQMHGEITISSRKGTQVID